MGWRCGGRTGWLGPGTCRGAMPISGPGREANAEAVSYEQSERRDRGWGCHMPQEPLKMFQWNRPLVLERLQASQHWLSTLLWETCCEVDRVQLHAEKRDPLRRGEFALSPVDLKPQPAEVTEHHIPVFAQQCPRLGRDSPKGRALYWYARPSNASGERSVSREDRNMEVGVLHDDRCKPIEGTDALKDASLRQHPDRELVKGPGPVQNAQVQD